MRRIKFIKKKQFITLLCIMSFGSLAAKSELRLTIPYSIISDSVVAEVPDGYCNVKGSVISSDTNTIQDGIVANYGMTHKTNVADGSFELLIPDTDSIVFFYSELYGEIIIYPYDFQSGHEVTLQFYPVLAGKFMSVDKPVIYCYSDQPLTASINLKFKGDFTFSYPVYDNGWEVEVNESGLLKTAKGKAFPYLFWEGETKELDFQANKNASYNGFYIQTDSVTSFLEKQLTALGLSRNEQTDFITYWAPRIVENEHVFIQFLVDEAYAENVAEIEITPMPDQIRRVYILYTAMNDAPDFEIKPQSFNPVNRKGFTVIEWGGSEMNFNAIQL
jgi:hypothetical protein